MDKHLEMRYNSATRFDESDLALSVCYKDTMHKLLTCMDQLALLGPAAATLAEELLESAYEVTEMETMHFFQEGYRAALLDGAGVPLWEDEGTGLPPNENG